MDISGTGGKHITMFDRQYSPEKQAEGLAISQAVEVRHGHWIGEIDDRDGHIWMECSECHKIRIVDDFCGACGTRMDKEDDHD